MFPIVLALLEEAKTLPFGAVWDHYCESSGVPVGDAWLADVRRYERDPGLRQRLHQGRYALGRVTLPRTEGPRQHRDRRAVDGRIADAGGRHPAPRAPQAPVVRYRQGRLPADDDTGHS